MTDARKITAFLAISAWFSATVLLIPVPSVSAGTRVAATAVEQQRYFRTELYFGRSIPGGGEVSSLEWERFLSEVVTPRFPDGFTVIPAMGQYRNRDRSIVKEQSELLILLYPASTRISSSRKIEEIRRSYKKQFRQDSVLRVDLTDRVRVRF